jgi:hypothetical protein
MKFAEKLLDGLRNLAEWFWYYVLLNPVAWLLSAFLIVAVHGNNKLQGQLDTVCTAIEIPDLYPYEPKTDFEKAQGICADRLNTGDMAED